MLVLRPEKPSAEATADDDHRRDGTAPGDAATGKAVFTSAGCAACHTFTPAGSTGTIGPNLDDLADYANKAGQPLEDFTTERDHPPAGEVRAARVPDERDADDLRQDAHTAADRRPRRVPRQRPVAPQPGALARAPLRFACPGEVAEWLKAAPC